MIAGRQFFLVPPFAYVKNDSSLILKKKHYLSIMKLTPIMNIFPGECISGSVLMHMHDLAGKLPHPWNLWNLGSPVWSSADHHSIKCLHAYCTVIIFSHMDFPSENLSSSLLQWVLKMQHDVGNEPYIARIVKTARHLKLEPAVLQPFP